MQKVTHIHFPAWVSVFYSVLAVGLSFWIIDLAENLPSRHQSNHWDAMWVGFDIFMLVAILTTIWFILTRKVWVVISASVLSTLFVMDAWFDILTAKPGSEQREAIFFGFFELLFAALTFRLVFRVLHGSANKKVRIVPKSKK